MPTENSKSTAVKGRVLVLFYSTDQDYVNKSAKRFKTEFASTKVKVDIPGVKLLGTECRHSMEEEMYPFLQGIYSERTSDNDLVAAVAIFNEHGYTERVVLYGDTDLFEYAPIKEITGEEKDRIAYESFRFRRKLVNSFNAAEKARLDKSVFANCDYRKTIQYGNESGTCEVHSSTMIERPEDVKNSTSAEFSAFLFAKKTFFLNGPFEEFCEPGHPSVYWGSPNPEGREYIKTRDDEIFYVEGVQPENSLPLYASFEQLLFWPDDTLDKFFYTGWCIRAGEKLWAFTNPFETQEEEMERAVRDKGLEVFRKEYFPLYWSEPRPFVFKHKEAEETFREMAAFYGNEKFADIFKLARQGDV